MILYVLVPIYVLVCVFLILVVLLQQGKGADVASAFGASSSQTTFGARGATTVFERITTWSFVAFSVLAVTISLVQSHGGRSSIAGEAEKIAKPASAKPAPAVPAPKAAVPATSAAAPFTSAPAPASAAPGTSAPAPAAPAPATK